MSLDIATLFVSIIVSSAVLAGAIAVVSYRRNAPMGSWALGLMTHGLAYLLFMLRGAIDDLASIVLANTLLATTFGLFISGIALFQRRRPSPWLLWGPIPVVAVLFYVFLDHLPARLVAGSLVYSAQCIGAVVTLAQYRHSTPGRGQYVVMSSFAILVGIFAVRILTALDGRVELLSIFSRNAVQHATFLGSIVSQLLFATGLVLMVGEHAEAGLRESQQALHARHLDLERYSHKLEDANRRLEALSITDALTGLLNRRRFDELLVTEWARARRHGYALGIVMLDIDHFKEFNDHYGHPAGDACLAQVAAALQKRGRRLVDVTARYGGEEFVMLVGGTAPVDVVRIAEAVREDVAALKLPHVRSTPGIVTVSIGTAVAIPDGEGTPLALLKKADDRLYEAKSAGRNRVVGSAAFDVATTA